MRTLGLILTCIGASFLYEGAIAHLFREPSWALALDRAWFTAGGVLVAAMCMERK